MPKDLYSILEVSRGADASEIKRSYYKLSRTYHPDKVADDEKSAAEAKFKEISAAYEILSDEQKRSYYDQTGQIPGEQGDGGGMPGGMPFPFGMGGPMAFDMNDLFGMFGGRGGRPQRPGMRHPGKAPARKTQIALTLKDFYYGRTLEMKFARSLFCPDCKGEGCRNTRACSDCNGQGVRRQIIQMGPMVMENVGACTTCHGSGKTKGDPCGTCSGSKFQKGEKVLQLVVKKGMKPGETIVFAGEASNVEEYAEAGDVVVELEAADEEHSIVRDGNALKDMVVLSLAQSLCGCSVRIQGHPAYPDGLVLDIPVGVQNKDVLVYPGKGMPHGEGQFGDFLLTVQIRPSSAELQVLQNNMAYFKGLFPSTEEPLSVGNKAARVVQ
jgi:DnaJ family protein A protein 2